jgi:hypothetical protein
VIFSEPKKSNLSACSKYISDIIESWEKVYD